ncbi:hypothetical protein B0H10DRAFT_1960078 [Mycena sp. CBHHK59/15]|nr:hypothetical protein B0H10DRAFT_1960072 [Mycena sp. CBHHK59/15]KAJ6596610.1 hypothetical protein B0H10DRAFT_1960078 [Mycena sp. CBHHK59/15]
MSREEVEDECREQRPSARESVNKREEMEVGASWDRPRETVSPSGGLVVADDERATGDGAGTKPESAPIGRSKALPPPPCVVELGRGGEGVVDVGAPSTCEKRPSLGQKTTPRHGFEGDWAIRHRPTSPRRRREPATSGGAWRARGARRAPSTCEERSSLGQKKNSAARIWGGLGDPPSPERAHAPIDGEGARRRGHLPPNLLLLPEGGSRDMRRTRATSISHIRRNSLLIP